MIKIIALIDYKNRFGSKHFDSPYRSGMDKQKLAKYFEQQGYIIDYVNFKDVEFSRQKFVNKNIIYTSSEDNGYNYKSYIEDIIFALELNGGNIIPNYSYLRANNNKVFMEFQREQLLPKEINNINSQHFGTLEELNSFINNIQFPCVLKSAAGASGKGVFLAISKKELIQKTKKLSRTKNLFYEWRDFGRAKIHSGYIRESKHRLKFIIQEYIPNLKNDWKIYFFGNRLYVFFRPVLPGRGIKASGGGYENYYYDQDSKAPIEMFDFAYKIYNSLNVPHISLDIAFDGKQFFLIEFQALYFGTAGIPYSKGYYSRQNNNWSFVSKQLEIEQVYAESIVSYINKT